MAAAVVVTANHYVIDVLAGLVVVLVGLAADRVIDGRPVRSAADGFPYRPSRRERPGEAPAGGDAGLRPHRGRPTGVARAGRDPAPEDPRADPAPVGPWALANPLAPRPVLGQLLAAVDPGTELLLDLKGHDPTLSRLVLEELSGRPTRVTICARSWRLLEPFAGRPGIRTVHSVGTTWELRRLRRRFSGGRLAGVSIHERLLDVATLSELHRLTTLVVTWPGQLPPAGARADRAGVDGLISDDPTPARLPPA